MTREEQRDKGTYKREDGRCNCCHRPTESFYLLDGIGWLCWRCCDAKHGISDHPECVYTTADPVLREVIERLCEEHISASHGCCDPGEDAPHFPHQALTYPCYPKTEQERHEAQVGKLTDFNCSVCDYIATLPF